MVEICLECEQTLYFGKVLLAAYMCYSCPVDRAGTSCQNMHVKRAQKHLLAGDWKFKYGSGHPKCFYSSC